jgi:hypothetical protein
MYSFFFSFFISFLLSRLISLPLVCLYFLFLSFSSSVFLSPLCLSYVSLALFRPVFPYFKTHNLKLHAASIDLVPEPTARTISHVLNL